MYSRVLSFRVFCSKGLRSSEFRVLLRAWVCKVQGFWASIV